MLRVLPPPFHWIRQGTNLVKAVMFAGKLIPIYMLYRMWPKSGYFSRRMGRKTNRYLGYKKAFKAGKPTSKNFVRAVKKIVNTTHQKQFLQVPYGSGVVSNVLGVANPCLYLLNGMTQGVTDNTRIGDRVRSHRLQINVVVTPPASATQTVNYAIRIILVKEPRGTAPSYLSVMGNATPSPFDFINNNTIDFNARYKVLLTRHFKVTPQTSTQVPVTCTSIDLNLHDLISDYSISNTGNITDMDKNAIYLSVISSETTNLSNLTIAYYMWYMDM